MFILMNSLSSILTSLLDDRLIYLVRQQQRGGSCGNHQGHLRRKREEDVMEMKEEKDEADVEYTEVYHNK